jgi:hypothetical protein
MMGIKNVAFVRARIWRFILDVAAVPRLAGIGGASGETSKFLSLVYSRSRAARFRREKTNSLTIPATVLTTLVIVLSLSGYFVLHIFLTTASSTHVSSDSLA